MNAYTQQPMTYKMKKINLVEAYTLLNKYKIDNAFEAMVQGNEIKSIKRLYFYRDLYRQIKSAERAAGIDINRYILEAYQQFDLQYFNPKLSNLYYKDSISEQDIDIVKDKQYDTKEQIKHYQDLINFDLERTYIEIGPIA